MKTRHSSVVVNDAACTPARAAVPELEPAPAPEVGPALQPVSREQVDRILRRLSDDLGPGRVERLFDHAAGISVENGRVDVTVHTGFSAEWLDRKFGTALRRAAEAELAPSDPSAVTLHFQVAPEQPRESGRETPANPARPGRHELEPGPDAPRPSSLYAGPREPRGPEPRAGEPGARRLPHRPAMRYRFDDFVVGATNRLAYSAALQVAEADDAASPAPLFIHGGCGLGKTHLLQALAGRFAERRPGSGVRYLTAETFTNEYITAVRNNQIDAFRKTYRGLDLLCLDDVHFLSSKEKTQNELLHTFDAINLGHARVVLASDGHPRDIQRLSEGLISRFMSGIVVRLDPPDAELRQRIVLQLARRRGLVLEPAAAKLLADHGSRPGEAGVSVRELEGLLLRVDAVQRLLPEFSATAGQVGILAVRRALGLDSTAGADARARRPIQIAAIISEVCASLHVDPSDLGGRGRHKRVVMARSLITYLARKLTTLSFPEIARALSRPNHSTVITAYQRITGRLETQGQQDLAPELGVEFTGIGLAELAGRLHTALARAGDGR
ncbi:MAG: ATP-binding protein [Phycisphaerales bacterium]|nr:ATP-binding protein [Phycisphaerales bacterium]